MQQFFQFLIQNKNFNSANMKTSLRIHLLKLIFLSVLDQLQGKYIPFSLVQLKLIFSFLYYI